MIGAAIVLSLVGAALAGLGAADLLRKTSRPATWADVIDMHGHQRPAALLALASAVCQTLAAVLTLLTL